MDEDLLVAGLALMFTAALAGSLRALHKEGWQIVATLPRNQGPDGSWRGVNLTYYGLITASAAVFAIAVRADHRGGGRLTAYQILGLGTAGLAAAAAVWLPDQPREPMDLARGLAALWNPTAILLLQTTWVGLFLYTGWSMVTGSVLSFHVHRDRI